MARVRVKSYTGRFKQRLIEASNQGVEEMGNVLIWRLRITLNVPGSSTETSKDGEPPRKQTGRGRAACRHKHVKGVSYVGFGKARHLWLHEAGRDYTRKRPGVTRSGHVVPAGTRRERRQSLGPTLDRAKKTLGKTWIKFTKRGLSKAK